MLFLLVFSDVGIAFGPLVESEAALNEVVKLLQANPAGKVWVVGHTDNVGPVASNLTLSGARSAAVG